MAPGGPRPAPMATIGLVARNVNGQVKVFDTDTGEEITDIVAHQKLKREQLAAKEAAANPGASAEDAITPDSEPAPPPLPAPIKTFNLDDDYDNTVER